jgi:hypothetical protein
MNEINIEEFLRNNKPVVKDNPTFMLEVQGRMKTVEGIKKEVDRQRRHGRFVILITLFIGVAVGIIATVFVMLFPMVKIKGQLADILASLAPWKPYLAIAAAIAVSLISIYLGDESSLIINKLRLLPPSKTDGGDCLTH